LAYSWLYFFAFEVQFTNLSQQKKNKKGFHDDDNPTQKTNWKKFLPSICGRVLENKEPLQYIKNISLISWPISFLIFLLDFLTIFHLNISWFRATISGMRSPLLAYIFISFVIKNTQWNKKQCCIFSLLCSPLLPFYLFHFILQALIPIAIAWYSGSQN